MLKATAIDGILDCPHCPAPSVLEPPDCAVSRPILFSFRGLMLAPVDRSDLEVLHRWEADPASLRLWTTRKDILSQEEFAQLFANRLRSYYHVFLMIRKQGRPVGFIYSYEPNFVDGHAYVTAFVEPVCRDRGIAARAGLLFAHYLFSYFSFTKLYCDVFEYNSRSLTALKGAGLSVEGVFRDHRFYGGRHWTMYRLALYREDFYRRFTPMLQRMLGLSRPGRE